MCSDLAPTVSSSPLGSSASLSGISWCSRSRLMPSPGRRGAGPLVFPAPGGGTLDVSAASWATTRPDRPTCGMCAASATACPDPTSGYPHRSRLRSHRPASAPVSLLACSSASPVGSFTPRAWPPSGFSAARTRLNTPPRRRADPCGTGPRSPRRRAAGLVAATTRRSSRRLRFSPRRRTSPSWRTRSALACALGRQFRPSRRAGPCRRITAPAAPRPPPKTPLSSCPLSASVPAPRPETPEGRRTPYRGPRVARERETSSPIPAVAWSETRIARGLAPEPVEVP